jgi:prepilin-type N-terminal cleavage/methylation domain-containing protein
LTRKGFTLIELVVVLSLFPLLLATIISAVGGQLKNIDQATASIRQQQAREMLLWRIMHDIRAGQRVLPITNPERLVLELKNGDIVEYFTLNGEAKRRINGTTQPLTTRGETGALAFAFNSKLVEITLDKLSVKASLRN